MSEEPLNREDDLQEDVRDTAEDTESGLDEAVDKSNQVPRQWKTK
jgi:hypothetical protein